MCRLYALRTDFEEVFVGGIATIFDASHDAFVKGSFASQRKLVDRLRESLGEISNKRSSERVTP